MAINVNAGGGVQAGGNIPTAGEMKDFSDGLKKADTTDLIKAMGQPGMEPWQKDAIMKELESRAQQSQESQGAGGAGGAGGGDDQDEIKKLLKKLMDGSISQEEMQKLSGMLGVKPEELEAMKGKGGGDSQGGGEGADIQGG